MICDPAQAACLSHSQQVLMASRMTDAQKLALLEQLFNSLPTQAQRQVYQGWERRVRVIERGYRLLEGRNGAK
ncbi:MAG: hypothetical protein AAGC91_01130 [Pseudomonadota bacterium]